MSLPLFPDEPRVIDGPLPPVERVPTSPPVRRAGRGPTRPPRPRSSSVSACWRSTARIPRG